MWTFNIIVFIILTTVVIFYTKGNNNIEDFLEFIHIPKNAGTTIENVAKDKNIKWGRFKPEHRNKVGTNKCTYWHVPPKHFYLNNYYDSDDTFCVIRDPRDRMVSEYSYRHKGKHNMNNKEDMNKWLKENMNEDNVYNGGLNCHFVPQHDYIYNDNNERTCNHILKFDSLTSEFNELMEKKDVDVRLNDDKKDNQSNFNLTVNDIDDENMQKIFKLYKKDFEIQNSL